MEKMSLGEKDPWSFLARSPRDKLDDEMWWWWEAYHKYTNNLKNHVQNVDKFSLCVHYVGIWALIVGRIIQIPVFIPFFWCPKKHDAIPQSFSFFLTEIL